MFCHYSDVEVGACEEQAAHEVTEQAVLCCLVVDNVNHGAVVAVRLHGKAPPFAAPYQRRHHNWE